MSAKINKNGKEYDLGFVPQSLYDDVEDLKEATTPIDLGEFATLASLETAIKNKLATMKKGEIATGILSTSANFEPFNMSVGFSFIIQARGDNNSNIGMIQVWNQLGYLFYGYCSSGTFTWKNRSYRTAIQAGLTSYTGDSSGWSYKTVTFPSAFKSIPLVTVNAPGDTSSATGHVLPMIDNISTTGFRFGWYTKSGTFSVRWQAVGEI